MKVAWDLDNTIFYSLFSFDFGYYYAIIPLEQFVSFHRLNRGINVDDVHTVLTARYEHERWITKMQLDCAGINANIVMYPYDVWTPEKALKFKADTLNKMRADYYVDDDMLLNMKLQPLLNRTKCITTDFFYSLKNS